MARRHAWPVLGLAFLFLSFTHGCGSSDDPTGPDDDPIDTEDTTVPGPVTDLRSVGVDGTLVTLAWTAPGDDGQTGTATEYDLRFGRSGITSSNWHSCYQCQAEPTPEVAGTEQTVAIDVGSTGDWYFALRAGDEAGNWSTLSNNAAARINEGPEPEYDIHQLTHSGTNRYPSLDDGFVVWVGYIEGGEEIFIAGITGAGATPSRLTDNGGEKLHPDNHGSERIVWSGRESGYFDWELWVYDKYATPRFRAITDDEANDHFPELAGGGDIAWIKGATMFGAIYYWNGSSHSAIEISEACCPTTTYTNSMISADDGAVIWRSSQRSGERDDRIYLYQNGLMSQLTDVLDARLAVHYSLDAGTVAYEYASDRTIRYWDGAAIHQIGYGYDPSLDDGKVAFEFWDGHDWEIGYWNGSTVFEITENETDDVDASLSGNYLAWAGRPDGSYQIMYVDLRSGPAGQ